MAVIMKALLRRHAFHYKPALRRHSSLLTDLIENMDKKETWDRFYQENNSTKDGSQNFRNFEWFFSFDAIQSFILPLLQPQSSHEAPKNALDMGCGTSAVGPGIYRHSPWPVRVTCADVSAVAIRLMREQQQSRAVQPGNTSSSLLFLELDCSQLLQQFSLCTFDLIVDKGTTDALLRSKEGPTKAGRVVQQCLRALRPSGSLLQFSDEDPDARLLWLEKQSGELGGGVPGVKVQEVGTLRGISYYCYTISPPSSP
ncbi:citrate synthase-lysine N-methyltransferase CSKMT, mitochondrial [Brienomyrus brachyistius]|uniref:citrate synthase-lysine N-methyltransferase CSKMT, mitochondrial n=1 Tax=Brienomyrus brachyistius TaxID=42636 RepID=UPI0020B24B8C|nr:citrate synthase-lysine N-methyltransferase CSKMT, mitochondrial [Brienomyrus brachyistius]XP_048884792.1 citrate synthase-lysine N-methyltransferase CSKMT, mitochondrial [Brienomyrus brachyistius]